MPRWTAALLLAASLLTGCASTPAVSGTFPTTWPAGTSVPTVTSTGRMGPGTGLVIAVAPWTWSGAEGTPAPATTDVLTQLTEATLRARGFEVVDPSSAPYRLACQVRDLTYTIRPGYPGEREYVAQAACQVVRASDQQTLWQRDIEERVDETLYVNTYTKLPAHHERGFARECLPALCERVVDSLLLFFQRELPRQPAPAASLENASTPAPAAAPEK